ncbi:MAG TPA: hypothetical protein VIV60_08205 [Polyangiaceae bacterium]
MRRSSARAILVLACVSACQRREHTEVGRRESATPRDSGTLAVAKPVDHLLPGELSASAEFVFGFPVPNGMHVERAFPTSVHLVGDVTLAAVSTYLKQHAQVSSPEYTGSLLVYDRVRLPNQGDARLYRVQIAQQGRQLRLVISDITPPPEQPGLTSDEAWRRAGRKPDGSPLSNADLR